ncbi:MAG: methylmalonyl-CoA epimerase [Rhodothermales bacterium]|nr:methylmalonyl-CoA epimerase [Rhodothermales bacterium]
MPPRIEHLGVAVRDAGAALDLYERLFGYRPYKRERVEREGVETVFLDAGGAKVELLEATRPDSPIAQFIEKRGEGLHHVAFEVEDVHRTMSELRERGFRLLNDAPKRGADEKLIFFVHPKSAGGVLVEFCQRAPEPLEPAFAPFRDGRVAYSLRGPESAPPLLVLHGALGSTELETRRLLPAWEPHFRTVAVDFPAHGRSDAFEGEALTMELFAEGALAVLDHLGIERAHAFGFSMGAVAVLYLAHHHADRLGRIALLGANVQWDEAEARQMTRGMNPEAMEGLAPRWAERLRHTHGADRWRALAHRMIAFTNALPQRRVADEDLAAIRHPALVAAGDADRYFRIEHALNLWRQMPNAQLAVLPGLDHPIQHVPVDRFGGMVADFLQAEEAEPARTRGV